MKSLIVLASLLVSFSSFAATVKITSYTYVKRPLAELCGQVEGHNGMTFVKVIVDNDGSKPANYNTVVDTDGKFCMAVITYRGTADAVVMGSKASTKIRH